ncbi:RagB/SusD family nutrient uptake outer membrane protein [Sphingobacterium athyrii]|uniref:RagB/SusD family nutrient uptake outer membrane protein n=1 Tax=Sphingobacterium athyrii TaxID=2152717 RepID=A0A363NUL2_9SPHI|nr:RagB/SusD family nutrient uptake outer membrane protein [Sphingobacterium athyrii]PUV24505.1 RagB/SusD family nutrient uptake outer membrane protein [Sphingobacterium athyrii]
MKLLQYSFLIVGLIAMIGCKKYLSEEPSKQSSLQTVDQMEALINNAGTFAAEPNCTAAYSTDDCEITKELYSKNPSVFGADQLQYYVFGIEGVANQNPDQLWSGEYEKIFTANLILENIDKVKGDDAIRRRVKADAHFIRAYSNWVLVNYYCAPYSPENLGSLGLPLKKTVDFLESGKRATLKETYDFILSDVAEAQKTAPDDVDPLLPWRSSQKTISAFLSRFYLFTGDYDKSLAEANKALTTSSRSLVDYNSLAQGNSATYSVNNSTITLNYTVLNDWKSYNGSKYLYWQESYYTRYVTNPYQWFIPSAKLLALYDTQNDLRYKKFMIKNGGLRMSVSDPAAFRYTMFYDGQYLPEGLTVAEVLLNKAEALARKGDLTAMDPLNQLRKKRMTTGHYVPLTATAKEDAITKVLEERRREMPFSMRWYDIRRFSVNDYAPDNINVTRNFFKASLTGVDVNSPKTYTLDAKRYLVPINNLDINTSKGQLEQNAY